MSGVSMKRFFRKFRSFQEMGKIFGYLKNQLKNKLYDEWDNDIIFKQLATIDQSNLINTSQSTHLNQQFISILCEKHNHIAVHS